MRLPLCFKTKTDFDTTEHLPILRARVLLIGAQIDMCYLALTFQSLAPPVTVRHDISRVVLGGYGFARKQRDM